jgi:hypothetical protein
MDRFYLSKLLDKDILTFTIEDTYVSYSYSDTVGTAKIIIDYIPIEKLKKLIMQDYKKTINTLDDTLHSWSKSINRGE